MATTGEIKSGSKDKVFFLHKTRKHFRKGLDLRGLPEATWGEYEELSDAKAKELRGQPRKARGGAKKAAAG